RPCPHAFRTRQDRVKVAEITSVTGALAHSSRVQNSLRQGFVESRQPGEYAQRIDDKSHTSFTNVSALHPKWVLTALIDQSHRSSM
ncbi:hypothetical protein, partial [Kibdelosporangium philippinense]|uniref:hypothetical protein n=1 Tax=Kibdelosporangium philippinense TaxID=211113 RepID=UPI0035EB7BD8